MPYGCDNIIKKIITLFIMLLLFSCFFSKAFAGYNIYISGDAQPVVGEKTVYTITIPKGTDITEAVILFSYNCCDFVLNNVDFSEKGYFTSSFGEELCVIEALDEYKNINEILDKDIEIYLELVFISGEKDLNLEILFKFAQENLPLTFNVTPRMPIASRITQLSFKNVSFEFDSCITVYDIKVGYNVENLTIDKIVTQYKNDKIELTENILKEGQMNKVYLSVISSDNQTTKYIFNVYRSTKSDDGIKDNESSNTKPDKDSSNNENENEQDKISDNEPGDINETEHPENNEKIPEKDNQPGEDTKTDYGNAKTDDDEKILNKYSAAVVISSIIMIICVCTGVVLKKYFKKKNGK